MFHSVEPVSILLIVPSLCTLLIVWESQNSLNHKSQTLWLCSVFTAGMAVVCLCFQLLISKKMVSCDFIQHSLIATSCIATGHLCAKQGINFTCFVLVFPLVCSCMCVHMAISASLRLDVAFVPLLMFTELLTFEMIHICSISEMLHSTASVDHITV